MTIAAPVELARRPIGRKHPNVQSLGVLFWRHVLKTETCWEWSGGTNNGYGRFHHTSIGSVYAHRLAYEMVRGPIPDGLSIDHLCRNTRCVNPDHLEAVPIKENILRGTSPSAQHAIKTHCVAGHLFDDENTYRPARGGRECKACRKEAWERFKAKRKA